MRENKLVGLLLLLLTFIVTSGKAQTVNYSAESNIIYYFTKYIDWPENMKSGDFVIGIYGDDNIFNELQKGITGRRVGNQRIVISKIENLQTDKFNCSIIFIAANKSSSLKYILESIQNEPILIVTEKKGMILNGSGMNMVIVDGKVKLEINKENIENRGLKVAVELLAFDKN